MSEFLNLYVLHFGAEHRTSTNELVEFLLSPILGQQITYYGLSYDGNPCGFATFMYYPEGHLGIVDHLVISPNQRGLGAFFSFCDLIARDIEEQRLPVNYLAAEIMLEEGAVATSIAPTSMVRLMRLIGFKVAKARYWAPDTSIVQDRDSCRAALLIASRPDRSTISTPEFVRILELIYRTHYAKWYKRTMRPNQYREYKEAADNLLENMILETSKQKKITLNGMKNLDLAFSIDPAPRADPPTLFYVALLTIPPAVGLAVAFTQERLVAAVAALLSASLILGFTRHPKLRRLIFKAFRLE
ncbi:hypothetical protein [Rhodopseudomonas palustris]|uniref:hypothetical protein n=1 Tax=Rhodopseudomonas palustris TaxID=1076 RepID=UPI001057D012|nr:hypothetical protein [Rhodopseudomonas palustris]